MKRKLFLIIPAALIGAIILFALLFILFLTIIEYRPKPIEDIGFTSGNEKIEKGKEISLLSWNIGYAGLGKDEDFFMDGGKKVRPDSKKVVEKYFEGIKKTIKENPSEIIFIQEIDLKSKRTWKINEYQALMEDTGKAGSFAYNYKCTYVPFPFPTIGHIESGLSILTNYETTSAQRRSLPVPFKWPIRLANLKRCILATRIPVYENGVASGKELVLADFHLEAFDKGEGKIAQTKALKEFIDSEYAKGNYVIAGGDFNQRFPGSTAFPPKWLNGWLPGQLDADMLEDGWQFVFDDSKPTCRSNSRTYNDEDAKNHDWQYHVIDGFIISPNISKLSMNVIDVDFQNSDHNPVKMTFELK
ncbi:MAG: endonuclease/exonuclease/phosphatase family protein [Treponema sp.]|nr:endonuclease/exonuclease/phosphatase family protein [Treponema sp.]